MKPRLLILRPEPGAGATAGRAAALGWDIVRTPLFTVVPLDWSPPAPSRFDAVMMTSANAARLGGPGLARFAHLPLYAVGRATTAAAQAAGFADVRSGDGDVEALVARATADRIRAMLHLAGREHRAASRAGMRIDTCILYAADPIGELPEAARAALAGGAIALIHSPRAAALFAELTDAAELPRATIRMAAISPAALAAAGGGWAAAIAASAPEDDALLAAAARLCE